MNVELLFPAGDGPTTQSYDGVHNVYIKHGDVNRVVLETTTGTHVEEGVGLSIKRATEPGE